MSTHRHTQMFIANLFRKISNWKQPKCLSIGEWIKKISSGYIYKTEYTAINGNKLMIYQAQGENPPTEVSGIKTPATTGCMSKLRWRIADQGALRWGRGEERPSLSGWWKYSITGFGWWLYKDYRYLRRFTALCQYYKALVWDYLEADKICLLQLHEYQQIIVSPLS